MRYSGQIRAARALLGMRQDQLAKAAKIGLATLQRIEQTDGLVQANFSTVLKIQGALEKAGIEFTDEDEFVGVRVSKKRWK
jgi:transcriptional regulator with XRE-family HTH domain